MDNYLETITDAGIIKDTYDFLKLHDDAREEIWPVDPEAVFMECFATMDEAFLKRCMALIDKINCFLLFKNLILAA